MQSTGEPPESIKTLSLIHNLSSNSILTEVKPKGNEDTQSLSPENVSSDYYKYPNYVYEGLSSDGMEIQTINQDTIGILKTDKEISGIILLTSRCMRTIIFTKFHIMVEDHMRLEEM